MELLEGEGKIGEGDAGYFSPKAQADEFGNRKAESADACAKLVALDIHGPKAPLGVTEPPLPVEKPMPSPRPHRTRRSARSSKEAGRSRARGTAVAHPSPRPGAPLFSPTPRKG